jgi:hypothetical protein
MTARCGLAITLAALVAAGAAAQETARLIIRLEPGRPLTADELVVPLTVTDPGGRPRSVTVSDLDVTVAGAELRRAELDRYAPAPGGRRSAVALLLAGPSREADVDSWYGLLEEQAASGGGAVRLAFAGGRRLEPLLEAGGRLAEAKKVRAELARDRTEQLWDTVVAALRRLETAELPQRRVLVVVTGAREDRTSELPLAACLEAAQRARVAVYAVGSLGAGADGHSALHARLEHLTAATGGRLVAAEPAGQLGALRRLLALIDGAQELHLQLAAPPELPVEVTVRVPWAGDAQATTKVRARTPIETRRPLPWPLAAAVIVVLGGLVALAVLRRRRPVGMLEMVDSGGPHRYAVTRAGLTIGAAGENSLVVSDRRVSRTHAVLRLRGREVVLTDLRSRNGTEVNGRRIVTTTLNDGDRIVLGGAVELIYRRAAPQRFVGSGRR